ncbi:MAG TPA: Sec-independent protein translocase protein TatB [Syntrophorhabdaceae bacterium]|nr:Sec-independent protein translocase protein TatB [Syntrophorhabdaceae bacterium]HQM81083.1 Sec-independent protein translocase protein TatB [Syntrophorhabdaceae bacterium]
MFGIGLPEIIVIMVVALLVVGPSKLPELAKSLGKAFSEFRRMADEVKETIEEEVAEGEALNEEKTRDGAAGEAYSVEPAGDTERNAQRTDGEEDKNIPEGGTLRG